MILSMTMSMIVTDIKSFVDSLIAKSSFRPLKNGHSGLVRGVQPCRNRKGININFDSRIEIIRCVQILPVSRPVRMLHHDTFNHSSRLFPIAMVFMTVSVTVSINNIGSEMVSLF